MRPRLPALVLATALLAPALTWSPAAADPRSDLTITMTDNAADAAAGAPLDYRITLTNADRAAPRTADVELTLPVGAHAVDVRDGGTAPEPWFAQWSLTVPAGGTTTVSAAFQAGQARAEAKGYAATACVVHNYARLLCATDMDQVPGSADIHAVATSTPTDGANPWLIPVVAGVLVAAAAGTALHLLSRRRARAEPAEVD